MMASRDPCRTFSPNGRPMRKPRKIVSEHWSQKSSYVNLQDLYVLERPRVAGWKHMSLQERRESRPPVERDLEGPSPCTYHPPLTTLGLSSGSLGMESSTGHGAIPSASCDLWTHKTGRYTKTPTACTYNMPHVFGPHSSIKRDAPAYSMGRRTTSKPGNAFVPAPNRYNSCRASSLTFVTFPAFTIARREAAPSATPKSTGSTPGPAHYSPRDACCKYSSPCYTMHGRGSAVPGRTAPHPSSMRPTKVN